MSWSKYTLIFIVGFISLIYSFQVAYTVYTTTQQNTKSIEKLKDHNKRLERLLQITQQRLKNAHNITGKLHQTTITICATSADGTSTSPTDEAFMQNTQPGTIAVSQDLAAQGWTAGRTVWIGGLGLRNISYRMADGTIQTQQGGFFTIRHIMHKQWHNRLDMWCGIQHQTHPFDVQQTSALLVIGNIL